MRSRAFRSFGVCPRPLAQEFKSADWHGKSRRTCASVRSRALSSSSHYSTTPSRRRSSTRGASTTRPIGARAGPPQRASERGGPRRPLVVPAKHHNARLQGPVAESDFPPSSADHRVAFLGGAPEDDVRGFDAGDHEARLHLVLGRGRGVSRYAGGDAGGDAGGVVPRPSRRVQRRAQEAAGVLRRHA